VAPSMRAASNGSLGSPSSPLRITRVANGVQRQSSIKMTERRAVEGRAIQGIAEKPNRVKSQLYRPYSGFKRYLHKVPTTTGGRNMGATKIDKNKYLPFVVFCNKSEITNPKKAPREILATVKREVTLTLFQKRGENNKSLKFQNQTSLIGSHGRARFHL